MFPYIEEKPDVIIGLLGGSNISVSVSETLSLKSKNIRILFTLIDWGFLVDVKKHFLKKTNDVVFLERKILINYFVM
jgi:hypothetical protein